MTMHEFKGRKGSYGHSWLVLDTYGNYNIRPILRFPKVSISFQLCRGSPKPYDRLIVLTQVHSSSRSFSSFPVGSGLLSVMTRRV